MKHSKLPASPVQNSAILSQFWEDITLKVNADAVPLIVVSPILERIEWWVGTQPELTQALCDYVVQYASQITEEKAEAIVDFIVEKEIANGWENGLAATHLNEISQVIVQNDRKDSVLILYLQILQRRKIPVNSSPEQAVLVNSGLVSAESGYLKVANALYEKAFSLKKLEEMLPGITKPVVLVSSADVRDRRPSAPANLYSKLAIAACGLVVVGAFISSYIRESGGRALATSSDVSNDELALATGTIASTPNRSVDTTTARADKTVVADRILFDNGEEYAANSRWVLMMREFCDIPETSMYFLPAQKQVEQLFLLHSVDIQLARDLVQSEKGATCSM